MQVYLSSRTEQRAHSIRGYAVVRQGFRGVRRRMLNRDRSASRSLPDVDWSLELQAPRGRRRAPGAGRPSAARRRAARRPGGARGGRRPVHPCRLRGPRGVVALSDVGGDGVPCPGCGATRAFVHFANGDFAGALHYNWSWLALWLALAGWALVMAPGRCAGGRWSGPSRGRSGRCFARGRGRPPPSRSRYCCSHG